MKMEQFYGLQSMMFSQADMKLWRACVDGRLRSPVRGELSQEEMVLSDVNPPPQAWALFF